MSWLPASGRIAGRLVDRHAVLPLLVALVTALAVNAAPSTSLRVNLSGSMPCVLYRLTTAPPTRGSLVAFCLDGGAAMLALERRYTRSGLCPGAASRWSNPSPQPRATS